MTLVHLLLFRSHMCTIILQLAYLVLIINLKRDCTGEFKRFEISLSSGLYVGLMGPYAARISRNVLHVYGQLVPVRSKAEM